MNQNSVSQHATLERRSGPHHGSAAHLALVSLRCAVGRHGDVHSRLHPVGQPDRRRHVGYQAVLTVFLANAIVLRADVADRPCRHQVRHPLCSAGACLVRHHGARLPALMRAIVACGWYGIQTWFGGQMIYTLARRDVGPIDSAATILPASASTPRSWCASWLSGPSSSGTSCTAWIRSASSKPIPRR